MTTLGCGLINRSPSVIESEAPQVLCRRWLPGWRPTEGSITLFDPGTVAIRRYRYRGAQIPTPWQGA